MKIPFFNKNKIKEEIKWPEPPPISKKKKKISVTIIFKNKMNTEYCKMYDVEDKISSLKSYYHFFDWFFRRKTDYYCMQHSKGATIIIRSEIHIVEFREEIIDEKENKS